MSRSFGTWIHWKMSSGLWDTEDQKIDFPPHVVSRDVCGWTSCHVDSFWHIWSGSFWTLMEVEPEAGHKNRVTAGVLRVMSRRSDWWGRTADTRKHSHTDSPPRPACRCCRFHLSLKSMWRSSAVSHLDSTCPAAVQVWQCIGSPSFWAEYKYWFYLVGGSRSSDVTYWWRCFTDHRSGLDDKTVAYVPHSFTWMH